MLIVGQKTVRLASSYEYVVTILREKMMEYISSSYLFICCTKSCGLDCDGLLRIDPTIEGRFIHGIVRVPVRFYFFRYS